MNLKTVYHRHILHFLLVFAFLSWVTFLAVLVLHIKKSPVFDDGFIDRVLQRLKSDLWPEATHNEVITSHSCRVNTTHGLLEGVTIADHSICQFTAVPYAAPPTGSLRFARPVEAEKWPGVMYATSTPSNCPQNFPKWAKFMMTPTTDKMSEDCLYLNVWAPPPKSDLKPILFFIHGGGYQFGSGSLDEVNGTFLALTENVVVVTINYRLNVFGFLKVTDDDDDLMSGNQALYDQAMAMEWIRKNGRSFGGDPDKLVLWGQGMGAISISIHLISPVTKGHFRRAIMTTGSMFTIKTMYNRHEDIADEFLGHVGCRPDNATDYEDEDYDGDHKSKTLPVEVKECLQEAPMTDILSAVRLVNSRNPTSFLFSADDDFFGGTNPQAILTESGISSHLSPNFSAAMIGFMADEGSLLLHSLSPSQFPADEVAPTLTVDDGKKFLNDLMVNRLSVPASVAGTGISSVFSGMDNSTDSKIILKAVVDAVGDNSFICPSLLLAEELARVGVGDLLTEDAGTSRKTVSVHGFVFGHRSSYNRLPKWFGAIHTEEIPLMFGYPLRYPDRFTDIEMAFTRKIMKTIGNFARDGNVAFGDIRWPKYDPDYPTILNLDPSAPTAKLDKDVHTKSCGQFRLALDLV